MGGNRTLASVSCLGGHEQHVTIPDAVGDQKPYPCSDQEKRVRFKEEDTDEYGGVESSYWPNYLWRARYIRRQ